MFVTLAQVGGEKKRRAFALSFPRFRKGKKLLWPVPGADRGNRRPSSAAADEHAPVPSPSGCQRGCLVQFAELGSGPPRGLKPTQIPLLGLDPGIHVFNPGVVPRPAIKTWVAGSGPATGHL
jgi:hypothetical protein